LAILKFELRIAHLLGKLVYHLNNASSHLALGIFQTEAHIYAWVSLDHYHPIYASQTAGMTSTCCHV
jgi:hypothetical protein